MPYYTSKPSLIDPLILFVLAIHPELPKVKGIVNKHWPIIEFFKRLNKIFSNGQIEDHKSIRFVRSSIWTLVMVVSIGSPNIVVKENALLVNW